MQAAAAAVAAVADTSAPSLTTKSVPALVRTLSPGRLPRFMPAETRKVGIAFEQDIAGASTLLQGCRSNGVVSHMCMFALISRCKLAAFGLFGTGLTL